MEALVPIASAAPKARRSRQAQVVWAGRRVTVGGDAPVRIQSMTNTDTVDVIGTAIQVKELALAGSEMVRLTVNTPEAAAAVPHVREQLDRMGIDVPLIGDFHYNGHRLLTDFPDCAQALSKYRINPGNVGKGDKHDRQFALMIEAALRWDKPVRIGVNWGSLDQELLAALMDENSRRTPPWQLKPIMYEALISSATESARRAAEIGMNPDQIILSCKVSGVQDLVSVYRELARRCDYPLHLGLTEAERAARVAAIHAPYHGRLAAELDSRKARRQPTVLVAVHSFTPVFKGAARSLHAGVLYNHHTAFPHLMLDLLRAEGDLEVGDNAPYAVSDATDYTIPVHGERRNLPHVELEIRQDLITSPEGQQAWAMRLARLLVEALRRYEAASLSA